jgi:hypothetical protein
MNSDNAIDLDRLRLTVPKATHSSLSSGKVLRPKLGDKFLKGPIALDWLATAGMQPGKALHVALALCFWAGVKRSTQVALSMAWLAKTLGVDRFSGYRGLAALERAGLVSVLRRRGRKSLVTFLDVPTGQVTMPNSDVILGYRGVRQ